MSPCQWIKEELGADWNHEVGWKPENKQSRGYNLLLESCRMVVSALVPLVLISNNLLSSNKALVCSTNFLLQTKLLYRRGVDDIVINRIFLFLFAVYFLSLGQSSLNKIGRNVRSKLAL